MTDKNEALCCFMLEQGDSLSEQMRYEEAITSYTQAIQLDLSFTFAYFNRGKALHKLYRYEEAITDFTQVIEIEPSNSSAYYNRGLLYFRLNCHGEAIADFTQVISIELSPAALVGPSLAALAYSDRSANYAALGNRRQARADYDRALALGYRPS